MLWKAASAPAEAKFTGKNGNTYKFYSLATDSIGFTETRKTSPEASTKVELKTGIENMNSDGSIIQVFPNPAEHQCSVVFNLSTSGEVGISLCDISGKIVKTIETQRYSSGKQTVRMTLDGIPDGLYFIKLADNTKSYYQKLVIKN